MEVVASLSQGRTAAAQCGLFTHKSVPVIFEPPCTYRMEAIYWCVCVYIRVPVWCHVPQDHILSHSVFLKVMLFSHRI